MPGCGHPLPNGADRPFQRGLLRLRGTGQTDQEQGIHQRHHPPLLPFKQGKSLRNIRRAIVKYVLGEG